MEPVTILLSTAMNDGGLMTTSNFGRTENYNKMMSNNSVKFSKSCHSDTNDNCLRMRAYYDELPLCGHLCKADGNLSKTGTCSPEILQYCCLLSVMKLPLGQHLSKADTKNCVVQMMSALEGVNCNMFSYGTGKIDSLIR